MQRGRRSMEGRENLHDGQLGMAFISCCGALHAQSRRRDSPGSALARVRAGDQIPLGEKHPDTGVSSEVISLFVISTPNESFSLLMRAHANTRANTLL